MSEDNSTYDQTLSDSGNVYEGGKEVNKRKLKESNLQEDKETGSHKVGSDAQEENQVSSKIVKFSESEDSHIAKIDQIYSEVSMNIKKRDIKNIEKYLSSPENYSRSSISQEELMNFDEQSINSSDENKVEKVLKDKLIKEIIDLMKIGERNFPIYPPWIQFRLNNWDPVLSKLYKRYKERWVDLFGFDYKLSKIKDSSETYNLIQEKSHPSWMNENESITNEKSLRNSNIKLTEMFDWIKYYGMKELRNKSWLSQQITNDLCRAWKSDIQIHYEDWWAYMFSIFDQYRIFTAEHLQMIYHYLDNIQKRHEILKKSTKVACIKGPFIYPYQLARSRVLYWIKHNKTVIERLSKICHDYNSDLIKIISEVKLRMIEIGNQINFDLKESVGRLNLALNKHNNKLLDPYEIFMRLEKRRDLDFDNREEIVYNDKFDYTIRRGLCIEADIPNMKDHKVIIPEKYKDIIMKDLTDLNAKCIEYCNFSNTYDGKHTEDCDDLVFKSELYDFSHMKINSYVKSEILKKDSKIKSQLLENNGKDLYSFSNKWIKEVERYQMMKSNFLNKRKWIWDFSWAKLNNWNDKIKNHIWKIKDLSLCNLKDVKFESSTEINKWIDHICELYYGSYPIMLEIESKSDEESKRLLSWIKRRNSTIKSTMTSPSFLNNSGEKLDHKGLEFIIREMENTEVNRKKQKLIGEQRNNLLSANSIINYPFESIIKLNSTRGRLHVLKNWEEIINHQNFKSQKEYSHVFGFKNPVDRSNFQNVFFFSNEILEASQETKLEIIHRLKLLLQTYIRELKPYIQFRYLIEKKISENLLESETAQSLSDFQEDSCYFLVCCLMYLYSILRHPMFDIDANMRAKMIWEKHSPSGKNTMKNIGCNWLYFIQTKNILESLKSKTYRKEEISTHFSKYFVWFDRKEKLEMRKTEKKRFVQKFQSVIHDDQMINILSEKFQVNLNILKQESSSKD